MYRKLLKSSFAIVVSFFLVLILSSYQIQSSPRINITNEFSLVIHFNNQEIDGLFQQVKELNPNIIYLRALTLPGAKTTLFAVSKYEDATRTTLDSAFYEQTVHSKPSNLGEYGNGYKLLSYNRYKKNNTILYTKVSNPMPGQCAVMFYFMKNNNSNILYEIKISGNISDIELLKQSAEKIALSVRI